MFNTNLSSYPYVSSIKNFFHIHWKSQKDENVWPRAHDAKVAVNYSHKSDLNYTLNSYLTFSQICLMIMINSWFKFQIPLIIFFRIVCLILQEKTNV